MTGLDSDRLEFERAICVCGHERRLHWDFRWDCRGLHEYAMCRCNTFKEVAV